jgi:hypothetical protein
MQIAMKTIAMPLALLTCACGADQAAFQPTDNVRATAAGQPAAVYDVRVDSAILAHVQVWSRGAERADDGRTYVHLVAEVQNIGDRPVQLAHDQLRLQAFGRKGAQLRPLRLVHVATERPAQSLQVPPGEAATVHLRFATPSSIDPDRIGGLRLRWALAYDDGRRYLQFTEFQQVSPPVYVEGYRYYDPVFGYYDPFLYGPSHAFFHHHRVRVPVGRVIVVDRDRPRRRVPRDASARARRQR